MVFAIIPPPRQSAPASDFALSAGLLQAHIIGRQPLDRLAAHYGFQTATLRDRLRAHVAACAAALEPAETTKPEPRAPIEVSPPSVSPVRVRERCRIT